MFRTAAGSVVRQDSEIVSMPKVRINGSIGKSSHYHSASDFYKMQRIPVA